MTQEPFRHSPGVFGTLAWVFRSISNAFSWLGDAASKVLWIRVVAPFFYTLDYWTWEAAIYFANADDWASDTWDAIQDRMRWDEWPSALDAFAHELKLLKDDPKGWFKYLAWRISDHFGWFVYDPVQWLKDRLRYDYPVLWAFLSDPRGYVHHVLWAINAELYYFALDPLGWIETQIGDLQADVTKFLDDPSSFIYDYLVKIGSPLAPFWADPGEWVVDHIIDWVVEAILEDWKTA